MAIGGSFPNPEFELYTVNRVNFLFPKHDCTILDVGPGSGKYGRLLKYFASQIDAIEAFEPTIEIDQIDKLYNKVYIGDICDFEFDYYDIVIFGDVLEHIEVERAQALLKKIYNKTKEIIIIVPFLYKQDEINNNPYEVHKQPDLTHELFLERYKGFKCLARNPYQGIYIKE